MSDSGVFSQLSPSLVKSLAELSITEPTPVQVKVIPDILAGKSLLFQSETGTGKTFAYLLPLISRLEQTENSAHAVRVLVCAPTFELASQIKEAVRSVTQMKCSLFIGGSPLKRQIDALKEKPEIVVGNPARLLELIQLKKLKVANLAAAVYDEADRLVKKESFDETAALNKLLPETAQRIACSATLTPAVKKFFAGTDETVMPPEDILRKRITHWALYAETRDKIDTLRSLLAAENPQKALIFTSRPDQVENIVSKLLFKKIACAALYAKQDKAERKAALDSFRNGKCRILVTSDVAARGLDIPSITHIIQMDIPDDDDFFVHRAGRTARAGKTGINIVIGDEWEMRKYARLEKKLHIIVYPKVLYNGKITAPEEQK